MPDFWICALLFYGMKNIFVLSAILCALCFSGLCQKIEWSVQKRELVGSYVGEMKNGLADGKGTAIGQDAYTGDFKKGLPDGKGIYTDSEGNIFKGSFQRGLKEGKGELTLRGMTRDSILKGYWEADKFIGKEKRDPYEVSNRTGSVVPRIYSAGSGNAVEITIIDPVTFDYITADILLKGWANLRTTYKRYYYEDATFPLEFDIHYDCNNKLGTSITANTIRIKINEPGYWVITLRN